MSQETLKCGRCKHFYAEAMECRRFPPAFAMWPSDNQHPVIYDTLIQYPMVSQVHPACGEYSELKK